MNRRGYHALADRLAASGATTAFGVMGEDTAGLTTTLIARGVRYVAVRHETAAVAMAAGFGRAGGTVGVALVSRGPGLLNALGACATADRAGIGLLVLTGDGPIAGGTRPGPALDLKAMDQVAAARACGLDARCPETGATLLPALDAALSHARTGRVAVLSLPVDLLDGDAGEFGDLDRAPGRDWLRLDPPPAPAPAIDAAAVDAAAALLARAKRPVLLAGSGAVAARDELVALAEHTGALLATSLAAKDLFRGHPSAVGIAGGFSGHAVRERLAACDLVIAFGAGLNRFTTAGGTLFGSSPVVQVDTAPDVLGLRHPIAAGVVGDAATVAVALRTAVPAAASPPRPAPAAAPAPPETAGARLDPRTLLQALDTRLPASRNVAVDCGHFVGYPSTHLAVEHPRRFFWSLQFGALGIGHGMGLGVAVARPDDVTVVVVGDGGLLLTLGELETLARHRMPALLVVLDDGAYAAEKHFLELHGEPGAAAEFGADTDVAGLATALGLPAATIHSLADLDALPEPLTGPFVLDCKIALVRAAWYEELMTGRYVPDEPTLA